MKIGFVICSRLNSSRVPRKAFKPIQGKLLIQHLIERILPCEIPVYIAVPEEQVTEYSDMVASLFQGKDVHLYSGNTGDPLRRMYSVALAEKLDVVIRVCVDKIFLEPDLIENALAVFKQRDLDYLYSSHFTQGSGFEVISFRALTEAASKFKGVEHISYAIRVVTKNIQEYDVPEPYRSRYRFLVDYPEDVTLLDLILSQIGPNASLAEAIHFMNQNAWARKINELPLLTVYTCAYNAEKYIEKCIGSVSSQPGFSGYEYVLVDDFSSDGTPAMAAKFTTTYKNSKLIRNSKNLGLASSSNVALEAARGKYILRLDADDYLVPGTTLQSLVAEMETTGKDVIYPANYFGSLKKVQPGREQHHVGGAIFRKSALNHLKFTDALRGYEGYDLFKRAQDQLSIGYYGLPVFFYRQRKDSMSKTNLEERARIKQAIDEGTL